MNNDVKYIKARIKTQRQIQIVYPGAKYWEMPLGPHRPFPSADDVILPYCGKIVWLARKRVVRDRFHYEIKDSGGLIVKPNWVDFFDSEELVSPAVYLLPCYEPEDDLWLDPDIERWIVVDDLLIVTG